MGSPPSGFRVMMFTIEQFIHTYIHSDIRSVSSLDSLTAPIKNAPTYSYTFFPTSNRNKTQNASQASSEKKAIRKPVLAVEERTRKRRRKKSSSPKLSTEEKNKLLPCLRFFFFFDCPVCYNLKRFVVKQ